MQYKVVKEEDLEADGSLDNMTFDQYVAANSDRTAITLSDDEINLIAQATGVNAANISVMAYSVPKFVAKTSTSRGISDYLMIILAVLIIALLIFAVSWYSTGQSIRRGTGAFSGAAFGYNKRKSVFG